MSSSEISALFVSCGGWYLPHTAKAFVNRGALAQLWISHGNHAGIPADKFRRAWPFQAAMMPLYWWASDTVTEQAFYAFFPLWKGWLAQQQFPSCNVVQAIMGYGTEPFARAEKRGALKVLDCPNSHPTTYYGFWQRECDLWCSGERLPIPRWMFARMNRELEQADLILCPSTFVRDSMLQNGIPEAKCFLSPFGVDLSIFQPRQNAPAKPRFICVGTICLRKGHQYLFRAWEIVKRTLPEAELVCVGEYKRDFRKERPHWQGKFTHRPRLNHNELAELLKSCTAFVFPSQEEGMPRAQIEAMACGLPVIGTYEAGTTTIVNHEREGLIVGGRDPEEIAAAMIRLGRDRNLAQAMGEAARAKIEAGHSWQQYGDRLLARYAKAVI